MLGRHVEGLPELQELRRAMDTEAPITDQLAVVFDAAVAHFHVEQSLRALLLTDPDLNRAHRQMAAATGLGPQLPVDEVAQWLRARRRSGQIGPDTDVRAVALLVCGSADYVATLERTVAAPAAEAAYGGRERVLAGLLPALGLTAPAEALAD